MDSAQHCHDQAKECRRLAKLAQSDAEAKLLKELAHSWSRVAGQIDRYQSLKREQRRNPASIAIPSPARGSDEVHHLR